MEGLPQREFGCRVARALQLHAAAHPRRTRERQRSGVRSGDPPRRRWSSVRDVHTWVHVACSTIAITFAGRSVGKCGSAPAQNPLLAAHGPAFRCHRRQTAHRASSMPSAR
jgi:hypothetical protein